MEDNVVLSYEMNQSGVAFFPPFFPRAPLLGLCVTEFFGIADVADGRVEPRVKHLTLGPFHRYGDSPIQVTRHGTWLEVHVEPALALSVDIRSEEHTSELQSRQYLVCRLLLEKKKKDNKKNSSSCITPTF